MGQLYFNNAHAELSANIDDSTTAIAVTNSVGLPAVLAAEDWFLLTVFTRSGLHGENIEIVRVDDTDGTNLVVVRGQEDTTAVDHSAGDPIEARFTAGTLDSVLAKLVAATTGAFVKEDGNQPAWTAPTPITLEVASDITVIVDSIIVQIAAGVTVALPALTAGTDYIVYAAVDGSLQAVDADSAAPSGERAVGGFHASAGAAEVVEPSLWDVNWRPEAPSPRGMVLSLDGKVWADIYLMDTQYALNNYSRNGAQIADGGSLPIIPAAYGGDGAALYSSMSWWTAMDLASAAGKRLPTYQEFAAFAFGVVERQSVGSDPVTTQHQAGHRSASGVEQATGTMQQWGGDPTITDQIGQSTIWNDRADGRGEYFAVRARPGAFGGSWSTTTRAGSRCSVWNAEPDTDTVSTGARAVCGHTNLQGRT